MTLPKGHRMAKFAAKSASLCFCDWQASLMYLLDVLHPNEPARRDAAGTYGGAEAMAAHATLPFKNRLVILRVARPEGTDIIEPL